MIDVTGLPLGLMRTSSQYGIEQKRQWTKCLSTSEIATNDAILTPNHRAPLTRSIKLALLTARSRQKAKQIIAAAVDHVTQYPY